MKNDVRKMIAELRIAVDRLEQRSKTLLSGKAYSFGSWNALLEYVSEDEAVMIGRAHADGLGHELRWHPNESCLGIIVLLDGRVEVRCPRADCASSKDLCSPHDVFVMNNSSDGGYIVKNTSDKASIIFIFIPADHLLASIYNGAQVV